MSTSTIERPVWEKLASSRIFGWGLLAILHMLALAAIIYVFPIENNWLRDGFDAPRKYIPYLATMTLWPLLLFRLSPAVGWAIALSSALFFTAHDYQQRPVGHISGAAQLVILALLIAVLVWSSPLVAGVASVATLMVAPFGFHFIPPKWNLDNMEWFRGGAGAANYSGVPGICWAIVLGLALRWILAYLGKTGTDSEIDRLTTVLQSDWSLFKAQGRRLIPACVRRRISGRHWLTILIVAAFGWQFADCWNSLEVMREIIYYLDSETSPRVELKLYSHPVQFGWAFALTAPLLLIRRYPVLGWVLAVVAAFAFSATFSKGFRFHGEYVAGPDNAPMLYVVVLSLLFMVVVRADLLMAGGAALVTVLLCFSEAPDSVALVIVVVALAAMVRWAAMSGQRLAAAEAKADEERHRRALLEERAHLARELHDVVAHHMSLVVVQAQTAPYRLPGTDPEAHKEFRAIADASRAALNEIRSLLGVLRSDEHVVEVAPQPGVGEIVALLEGAKTAGVPVRWTINGEPAIGDASGLALYRITQESLANAARHAPGAEVRVELCYTDRATLTVANDAPEQPAANSGDGHGIAGMRERAAAVGGQLTAGPTSAGGFEVTASLP